MQPPAAAAAPIIKRKAVPDAYASSSATTLRAGVHDGGDAIASHENVLQSSSLPYSPPMSPTLSDRSSLALTTFDVRNSLTPTVHAHVSPIPIVDAHAAAASRSQLARAASSATTATTSGPPPSYSRYEDNIQTISADQLAMLPPAPPGMVYLIASNNGHEKIMTR
jgi:hypothetical protein